MSTTSDCVPKFLTNNFDVNGYFDLVVVWTLTLNDFTSLSVRLRLALT